MRQNIYKQLFASKKEEATYLEYSDATCSRHIMCLFLVFLQMTGMANRQSYKVRLDCFSGGDRHSAVGKLGRQAGQGTNSTTSPKVRYLSLCTVPNLFQSLEGN